LATPPDSLPPEVIEALKLGKPIEAIKRLRKSTGLGLAEAKSVIDAFASGNTAYQTPSAKKARRRRDSEPAAASVPPQTSHPHQYDPPPERLMPTRGGLGQGEVPRSNAAFWLVVFLAIVALVGFFALD
jgi:hypothetical protein